MSSSLPRGIVPVLQTPFTGTGAVDFTSLDKLISAARQNGANGFVAPVVASEVDFLSMEEREKLVYFIANRVQGRVPLIVGASSNNPRRCRHFARLAESVGAAGYLVAVPPQLYGHPRRILEFFEAAAKGIDLPLIIQDLQWHGSGLPLSTVLQLHKRIRHLAGLKIETVPAGPKYTGVREALGEGFFIAGGWAVPQMIEALDRGVDALVPESAMILVYSAIYRAYIHGDRARAMHLFRQLIPVLTFTNQELGLSIAFFKRLLVRKKVFRTPRIRLPWGGWDRFNKRIADELIELYLRLEGEVRQSTSV